MSYCRFQNTLADLRDCWNNMDDVCVDLVNEKSYEKRKEILERSKLSYAEADAMIDLVALCRDIVENFVTDMELVPVDDSDED